MFNSLDLKWCDDCQERQLFEAIETHALPTALACTVCGAAYLGGPMTDGVATARVLSTAAH